MSIWRFADWIDAPPESARLTLGEGDTPLVPSRRIGPAEGFERLLLKLEHANPSGSYKDRFAASAISHMVAAGKTRCVATSSGNTGAALAAYCAAAGIACEIAIVETAPLGKLHQMMAYGADVYRVRGFGLDDAITQRVVDRLHELGNRANAQLQISAFRYSPAGMCGVETIAHELAEQAEAIDHVFCPAGGGGLTLAVARGFSKLLDSGRIGRGPRIECVQPAGNDTIAGPLRSGADRAQGVRCTSQISGLQVASVIDGDEVIPACRTSGGTGHTVDDETIWRVQARLAREEGIYCEPAGAVALAAAIEARRRGEISPSATVVCLVTGFAFKDPPSVERMLAGAECPTIEVDQLADRTGA